MAKIERKDTVQGELVFGIHPIIELLTMKRRKLITLYTTKPTPKAWQQVEKLLPSYPFNLQYVARDVMTRLAGTDDHQGIVAWAGPFVFRKKCFEAAKSPSVLLLDSIQDTHNLGAILRSAYCTGIDGVVLCKKGAAPLNASALKASAGLAERLEIYLAPSAAAAIQELKQAGYTIYLAVADAKATNAMQVQYARPACLVIGNEATGIAKALLSSGVPITLPQKSPDVSYNASVAAGILLFIMQNQQA